MPKLQEALKKPVRRLRATPSRGVKGDNAIQRNGGDMHAGLIRGAAICTRGEALGHGEWIDHEFLQQTVDGVNAKSRGAKARFTHPSLSGDGLGSYLGRAKNARLDGEVARADIHFSPVAHDAPDGDLAGYVMDLAEQDPEAFGTSIVYMPDVGAEDRHEAEYTDEHGRFHSPDENNADNLPHARLARLLAADVVDFPAANPDGLFSAGQEMAIEADALLAYSLGLSRTPPALTQFDLDADRAAGFVRRFLDRHNLTIAQKETPMPKPTKRQQNDSADAAAEKPAEKPAEQPEQKPAEKPEEKPEDKPAETPAAEQESAGPAQCKRFLDAFGPDGAKWFAEGLSFEAAKDKYIQALQTENADLRRRLQAVDRGETDPAQFQAAEDDERTAAVKKHAETLGENIGRFAAGLKKKK